MATSRTPLALAGALFVTACLGAACTPLVGSRTARGDAAVTDAAMRDASAVDAVSGVRACPTPPGGESGEPDPTLYGREVPAGFPPLYLTGAFQDGAGRIYVYGHVPDCVGADTGPDAIVARFDEHGRLDASFAGRGWACVSRDGARGTSEAFLGMALDPRGRPLLVGFATPQNPLNHAGLVARFTELGDLDGSFGDGGTRYYSLTGSARGTVVYAAVAEADGVVLVGADDSQFGQPTLGFMARILDHGELDPGFRGGAAWIDRNAAGYSDVEREPRGYAAAGYTRDGWRARVALLARDGAPVPGFGQGGVTTHDVRGQFQVRGLAIDAGGGFVVSGGAPSLASADTRQFVALQRFGPDGRPDRDFGRDGTFLGPAFTDVSSALHPTFAAQCDRGFITVGISADGTTLLRVTPRGALDTTFGESGVRRLAVDHARAALVDARDGRVTVVTRRATDALTAFWRYLP